MQVNGKPWRTVWLEKEPGAVGIIDQRWLPFRFETVVLRSTADAAHAIAEMLVRGAGCIGAVAAHGMYLAAVECAAELAGEGAGDSGSSGATGSASADTADTARRFDEGLREKGEQLCATRPTAVNLRWAVDRQLARVVEESDPVAKVAAARAEAQAVADEDADWCRRIGEHGLPLIEEIHRRKREAGGEGTVNILTHCNAGWLAFVDHGSATAPIYAAQAAGIPLHVWVDETRPRNQGARLTAWELGQQGVPHTVIVDNAGGHLMQRGQVDMVLTGTDRTTHTGDVANKIGTYLKALAARDNGLPFYVALPSSTFDWEIRDGVGEIPIEQRGDDEVACIEGLLAEGEGEKDRETRMKLVAPGSDVANFAFDVTPARLVTALITERGVVEAREAAIGAMFGR